MPGSHVEPEFQLRAEFEFEPEFDVEPASEPEPTPEADREHRSEPAPAHRALVTDLLPAHQHRHRRRRPRHRRRTWLPLASILVLAAVAVTGTGSWLAGRPGHPGAGTATGQADPQRTALLLLRDSDEVVAAALLGVSAQDGVAVLIPAGLVLEVPGTGRQPLDAAYATRSTAPANALSDALGVRVDGTWVLSTAGLAALVDSIGGVSVDVADDLNWHGVQLVQGPGQRLDGTSAAAFASADMAGEPEESHLARFGSVLGGLLAGLPPQQRTIGAQLAALGKESSDQLPSGRLAEMLWHARGLAQSDSWQGFVLPIQLSEVGDSTVQGLDAARARQLVERQLPGARIPEPSGGVVRVLVRNGVGVPKLSEAARDRLVAADLRFVAGGNADGFGRRSTVILIASDSRTDRDRGERVARALGVRPAQIQVNPLGSAMADVVVVLGKDFADDVARLSVRG